MTQRTNPCTSRLAVILTFLIAYLVAPAGLLSFSDNSCQSPSTSDPTAIQYRTCLSEPLAVLGANVSRFTLTVLPPNVTCGSPRELSCTLGIYQTCSFCDNTDPALRHPPEMMTDYDSSINSANLATFWQSTTWAQAGYRPQAYITISFNRLLQLWDDLVVTFKSVRPQQMILEKSVDNGATWQTLQYFNKSCKALWDSGVATGVTAVAPDIVTCTQDYSVEYPSVDGQVIFSVSDRFRLFLGPSFLDYASLYYAFNSTNLIQFLSFTDLRIQLLYPATDGKENFNDRKDLIRYYYAVSDIRVIAGCWCNLHAKYCILSGDKMVCQCNHNTWGDNCERCLPLYNNRLWSQGSYLPYPTGTPNECQACTCYNHSTSCTFDLSLGYGRCDSCLHNTAGPRCDQCLAGFFLNGSLSLSDQNICVPCTCQVLGVINNDMTCTMSNGQCNCKPLVMGRQCDVCYDGYYGLMALQGVCQGCSCNLAGTVGQSNVCDKQTGQCPCKPGITSRDCSICRDGFYQFPYFFTTQDCTSCQCDPGGSYGPSCAKQDGQCPCRPNMTGRRCSLPNDGYYIPLIDMNNLKPNPVTCQSGTSLVRPDRPYTDRSYVLCNQSNSASFDPLLRKFQPKLIASYIPALRYGLNGSLVWSSVTVSIRPNGMNNTFNITQYNNDPATIVPPSCYQPMPFTVSMQNLTAGYGSVWVNVNATVQMDIRCSYSATLTADTPGGGVQPLLVDSLVLIPDYHQTTVYANETNPIVLQQYNDCVRHYLALQARDLTKQDATCRQFMLSAMAEFVQGAFQCDCDPVGSISTMCDSVGGQCQCRYGVAGRRCEYCQQGFYNFTFNGCTPCNCDALGSSSPVCNYTSGQCPCLPNVALAGQMTTAGQPSDLQCHLCLANYSGVTLGRGCQLCSCNPIGGLSSQCDETGQCPCRPTIGGFKCDVCQAGYFGFSAAGCTLCNCSTDGSLNITCDNLSGSCYCKANVEGSKCDRCKSGKFNIAAGNPEGCQSCFCFGHGAICNSSSGFSELIISDDATTWKPALDNITYITAPSKFLGDMHTSYGQWIIYTAQARPGVVVNISSTSQPVILEGNGSRLAFRPSNLNVTDVASQLTVTLHQSFWYYANDDKRFLDAMSFYAVLGNLSRILIQQRFDYDFITVTAVSMRSAAPSVDGSSQVTYVENCTCDPTRNVAGLSCSSCSQGFQRPTPASSLFSTCIPCNCNGRSSICNEWTGECVACRNGSIGLHCETCAPNVASPGCSACLPGFWNLSKTGCSNCSCVIPFSSSQTCNATTGQCPCVPERHVGGLQCDQCLDNYINVSGTCQPCNMCFGLVVDQMKLLRANQTNLAALINTILSQDNSTLLGPFYDRLSAIQSNVSLLNDFSFRANALELTLSSAIMALRTTLLNLTITIATAIDPPTRTMTTNIQSARDNIAASLADINSTTTTLIQAYNQLTNDMPRFTDQLNNLMASLQTVLSMITGNSEVIISGIQLLNQTVNAIESNAASASSSSQLALQTMQMAKSLQDALLNQQLPAMSQLIQTLNASGIQTNASAYAAFSNALSLFQNASLLLQNIQTFTLSPVDVAGTAAIIQQQILTANTLTNQTLAAQATSQPTLTDVQTDNTLTSQIILQLNANKSSVDALNVRIAAANQTAVNAVNLAQNTTDQAQRMLNIMTSFDATAQAVQSKANDSLQMVQRIRDMSQQASVAADQILASLQNSVTSSTQAQQLATLAVSQANSINQALGPISDKANLLNTQSSSVLNDIQAKSADIYQQNMTSVAVLSDSLSRYLAATAALEQRAALAKMTADNVTVQVQMMQSNISNLQVRLQAIQIPDSNAIAQLQSDVQQLHTYYNNLGLPATVANLNLTITNQRITINGIKNKRDDLQQQIARIASLLTKLGN